MRGMTPSLPTVHYLEFVTPDVDAACASYASVHRIEFSSPVPELAGARVARLPDGTEWGIRAPMGDQETPVVRAYLLVDDLDAAVARAREQGAEIALEGMEIPGRGRIAIFFQGGIQHGLWEA